MEYASSIQAVALRVCKLGADGAPLVGTQNAFVTSQFTRVSFTPEYEEGEEVSDKAADGTVCVYYKMPDTLKKVNLEVAICNPQPEIYEFLADGSLLVSAAGTAKTISNKALTANIVTLTTSTAHTFAVGDTVTVAGVGAPFDGTYTILTVPTTTTFTYAKTNADVVSAAATGTATKQGSTLGWAAPLQSEEANPNGLGLEVWTRAIVNGRLASVNPYWRWVFPFAKLRMDGERALENGSVANAFAGQAGGNVAFGDGPASDWAFPAATASALSFARDATAPTGVNNYQAVA